MPQQKTFETDPENPEAISGMFDLARSLVMDGWGATIRANPGQVVMVTNAPMNIINAYLPQTTV